MSAFDVTFTSLQNDIGNLKTTIYLLKQKIAETIAPAFYGANLSRERFEVMLNNIPESDQLTVFVPAANKYIKMAFGDGTNSDTLSEGCDNYIMYTIYDSNFEEYDGGMMEFNDYQRYYKGDIRRAALDVVAMACGYTKDGEFLDFIPLTTDYEI